jgi:flavin reductase (DIM6/NTAB) family NADH-FMN oxidoreductase RutF
MQQLSASRLVTLDTSEPIWDQFFMVMPLVLAGTREEDGSYDLAPKHMVMPMSWDNYVGFVCTPRHGTYQNVERDGVFTLSYLRPSQVLEASFAAAPRCDDGRKHGTVAISQFPARQIDGVFAEGGYLYLECELDRILDGFGVNSLIIGRIVGARVDAEALRGPERDDQDLIYHAPILAYLHPGRFASLEETRSFPFPEGMKE